jgi:hypothetical protein
MTKQGGLESVRLENELSEAAERLSTNICEPTEGFWQEAVGQTKQLLSRALAAEADLLANKAWFLHKTADIRLSFILCFERLKKHDFYKAWCDLEQIEIGLDRLSNNPFYDISRFQVEELQTLVAAWQSLFPYHVFFSPEFLISKEECGICGAGSDPWSACQHRKGFVYGGRECIRIVKGAKLLSISLVLDPVQKYSVLFTQDAEGKRSDQYDYSIVTFVAERIASPFDGWSAHWTEAHHPHEIFHDLGTQNPCPCESGRRYNDCCLPKPGVVRPHLQIVFEKHPPTNLPNAVLAGYGERNCAASLTPSSIDETQQDVTLMKLTPRSRSSASPAPPRVP